MNTELSARIVELEYNPDAVAGAVALWADARTDPGSDRRVDLLRDKSKAVGAFFDYTGKHPALVTVIDVKTWQAKLEAQRLAPATVYAMVSKVSSFYTWALADPTLAQVVHSNPVNLARPKAPKAYQNESAQALTDDELRALVTVVKEKADSGSVVGKRDYAMLRFYLATGMRRREIAQLRWGDVKINGTITLAGVVKGGDYREREVADPAVRDALLDYLEASDRLDGMIAESPLWTRHDRAGKPGKMLTSHAFVKNLKRYAQQAGIGDVHLHQTRHTVARIAGEAKGSMSEVQEILDQKSASATRVYLRRISVKKDRISAVVAERLGL